MQDDRLRIGFWEPDAGHAEGLDPAILERLKSTATHLADRGHQLEPVLFSWMDFLVPCYYVLATAEASSNLSRYDGVRYGYRGSNEKELRKMYRSTRTEGFGPEVKRRILLGAFVLSSGYYDTYYGKAQEVRRRIRHSMEEWFGEFDLLLLPTAPTPPWKSGEHREDPTEAYLADVFTVLANLTGFPAVSIPAGSDAQGLPIGMQLMAGPWQEAKLFQLMREWEHTSGD
jgi:aspartyl-tRNA(Asn)/glutamyl-tRNA(Gln) amidotransferase subunit A